MLAYKKANIPQSHFWVECNGFIEHLVVHAKDGQFKQKVIDFKILHRLRQFSLKTIGIKIKKNNYVSLCCISLKNGRFSSWGGYNQTNLSMEICLLIILIQKFLLIYRFMPIVSHKNIVQIFVPVNFQRLLFP